MREEEKHRKIWSVFTIVLIVLIMLIITLVIICRTDAPAAQKIEEVITGDSTAVEKNDGTISIPGYEGITLQADTLEQNISFKNPEQNNCYFVITLCLEDGTQLWQSDLIEPGDVSSPVTLTQTLSKGTYANAVLRYDCFEMNKERTQFNGAETKLTLHVK
jgi:hypothetical protein